MILSGKKIAEEVQKGNIRIEPFNNKNVGHNSYDLTLHNQLLIYKEDILDMKKKNETKEITIPEEGLLLEPGQLYLGRTVERTGSNAFVPMIEGRSSVGRLGLCIHVTAGFGDIGFNGTWTLEIFCLKPIRIYPGVRIGQLYFHTIDGDFELYGQREDYVSKYNNQESVKSSQLYDDF